MTRIPLDLYAEVEDASGTRYRWDHNQAPGSRLRNFSFRTKIGEGFSDASGQLARRIDLDYPDLGLLNTVSFVGADGTVAYEGRISAMPRELSDTHSIGVTLTGWMAHAKDRKFQEVYIDRDIGRWRTPGTVRRVAVATGGQGLGSIGTGSGASGAPALMLSFTGAWGAAGIGSEAYYEAPPGLTLAELGTSWEVNGNISTVAAFFFNAYSTDDEVTFPELTGDQLTGASTTGSFTFSPTPRHEMMVRLAFSGAGGVGGATYEIALTDLRVFGDHGLTVRGTSPNQGFYASDMIRDIAQRFCPQLDTSGVQDTTYEIQQASFYERTYPYDAFLEVNKHHLWHLGVWENKRLDFRPYDLTDYDWEIRTDDPGTSFSPQGPSTEALFNGITVSFQDYAGQSRMLTPDDDDSLADTSSSNPWNQHGLQHWDEITLSTPSTSDEATQLARAALADRNAPKNPGTITVKGYIRDRAGNYQPVWKPRAGQTIAITNFPNDSARLIVETDYNDEDKSVRIAVDRPFQLLEAYLDRQQNALQARNLI